jgi:hypothetical protein
MNTIYNQMNVNIPKETRLTIHIINNQKYLPRSSFGLV